MREGCRLQIKIADDAIPIGLSGGRVGVRGGIDLLGDSRGTIIYADAQRMLARTQPLGQLIALRCRYIV